VGTEPPVFNPLEGRAESNFREYRAETYVSLYNFAHQTRSTVLGRLQARAFSAGAPGRGTPD